MDTGAELLAQLYESMKQQHRTLFEQGLKVQALELTLRSFPDTKPVYEEALRRAKTPEVVQAMDLSMKGFDATIALIRSGQYPSD